MTAGTLDKSQLLEVRTAVEDFLKTHNHMFIAWQEPEGLQSSGRWVLGTGELNAAGEFVPGKGKRLEDSVSYSALVEKALRSI